MSSTTMVAAHLHKSSFSVRAWLEQDGELDLSMEWEEHLELDFLDEDVHFMCDRTFLSNDQYLTDVED